MPNYNPSFDTPLSPVDEVLYRLWKRQYAPTDPGTNYDYRGAYAAGQMPMPPSGHWTDRFKKPNYPTFSVESQYAGAYPERAGRWEGDQYIPAAGGKVSTVNEAKYERELNADFERNLRKRRFTPIKGPQFDPGDVPIMEGSPAGQLMYEPNWGHGDFFMTAQMGTEDVNNPLRYAQGTDSVPAMLTPHEAVLTPIAADIIGRDTIKQANAMGNMMAQRMQAGTEDVTNPLFGGNTSALPTVPQNNLAPIPDLGGFGPQPGQPWMPEQVRQTYQALGDSPYANLRPAQLGRVLLGLGPAPPRPHVNPPPHPTMMFQEGTSDVTNPLQGTTPILGGRLAGYEQQFIEAGRKYGVDPVLLMAMASFETGHGTSSMLRTKSNVAGITNPGGQTYRTFANIPESIDAMASNLKRNYINKGLTTIPQIGAKWAPPGASNDPNKTNAEWPAGVNKYYQQLSGVTLGPKPGAPGWAESLTGLPQSPLYAGGPYPPAGSPPYGRNSAGMSSFASMRDGQWGIDPESDYIKGLVGNVPSGATEGIGLGLSSAGKDIQKQAASAQASAQAAMAAARSGVPLSISLGDPLAALRPNPLINQSLADPLTALLSAGLVGGGT